MRGVVRLDTASYRGKADWLLNATASDVAGSFAVGVGYDPEHGTKDGCLHLSKGGSVFSPSMCMDNGGQWWIRERGKFCPLEHDSRRK